MTCGVRDGRLVLSRGEVDRDLGAVATMPLTVGGNARYNVANLAGAALVGGGPRRRARDHCARVRARSARTRPTTWGA